MSSITLLFFAHFKELAGTRQAELEIPAGTSVTQLKALVAARFPALAAGMATAVLSINKEFAFDQELVPPGAEVALFPPVSGGKK